MQTLYGGQDALRRCGAGGIGNRMRGFDDLDAGRRHAVAIARDDEAGQRRSGGPVRLDGGGHRGSGLAGADDDRAPGRRGGQMRRQAMCGVGAVHRGVEQRAQQLAGRHRAFRQPKLSDVAPSGRYSAPTQCA